jgi:HPt (histidine-containing phosphotransfer) domain-containing protein
VSDHSSPELLNTETLEDLAMLESSRPGLIGELTRKFEVARVAQLAELDLSLRRGDNEQAALLLHSLRGGAAALAMQSLAAALDQLEAHLPAGVETLPALSNLMRASISALRDQFPLSA